jgi:uncharacterized protein (TIGR03067 family)
MKSVRIALLATFVFASATLSWAADPEAIKKDISKLQGEWSMVTGVADGQPMPDEMRKQMKRVCKANETTTTMGDQIYLKAQFTVDPSKSPKTIDYQMTEGATAGKKQLGIYEVGGDTFKACFAKPGAERPSDFSSKAGDGRTFSVWKREKPSS